MDDTPSIAELERRMRPGAYSGGGFLGPTESLTAVLERDSRTLQRLGLTHEQVATALESILQQVLQQRDDLLATDYAQYSRREWGSKVPNLYRTEPGPPFSLDNLPGTDVGYLLPDQLQVFIAQYRGFQECPWGCEYAPWGSFDFLILDRQSGQWVTGPGLIVHLIRRHQFFEGEASPYRLDPAAVAHLLKLASRAAPGQPPLDGG